MNKMEKNIQSKTRKGSPRPKQTKEEREACKTKSESERFELMNIIGTQYLRGSGAYTISEYLKTIGKKLSVRSVYTYIEKLKEEWMNQRLSAVDEQVARVLANIDLIEREAWEAWDRSKKDRQKSTNKTIFNPPKEKQTIPTIKSNEVLKATEQSNGDAEFLKIVLMCQDKRLEIIGFGKINLNFNQTNINSTNTENRISQQFMGGIVINRVPRDRPETIDADIISPLAKQLQDEKFSK